MKLLQTIVRALLRPVINQWPVLLAYIVWVGWSSLLQNPFYRWFIIVLHAWLVAALVEWSRSRVVKGLAYVLMFVLFVVEATLESCYELAISPSMLLLLVETNTQETHEFLRTLVVMPPFWLTMGAALLTVLLAWQAERRRLRVAAWLQQRRPRRMLSIVVPLWLAVGLACSWCYVSLLQCTTTDQVSDWNQRMRHPADAMTRVLIALFDTRLSDREMDEAISHAHVTMPAQTTANGDTLNVVLVIGESYIRQHSQLYGYPMATTPFQLAEQQRGRLFAFTDAVSPYNLTTHVIRNMLSCNSMADGERWSELPPLTAVFRAAGYHVEMYDNQKDFHLATTFSYALNTFLYHPDMAALCYDETNDRAFDHDADLISYYRQQPHAQAARRLTVFHLMGQHAQAAMRYPQNDPRFSRFTADSLGWRREPWLTQRKRQEIAYYDNATLYNDYVVQQITALYQDRPTVVVSLSDHGEEVYDYRDNIGRAGSNNLRQLLSHQYAVPLTVWCSDQYQRQHPDVVTRLSRSVQRPLMSDNICQLLFGLAGLTEQPYYHAQRDVLSPSYRCGRRIVNERYDYDEIMKQNPEKK